MPMPAMRAVRPELAERLRGHAALALPELQRVVLDPAGLRVVLRKGLLRHRGDAAAAVEENGAGAGRAPGRAQKE